MSEKARAHIIVSGRVQGVFFRAFTESTAQEHGLSGWARNLPSGEVEILFEGDSEDIKKAIEACRKGPPHARVDDLREQWEKPTGEFSTFSIRH